MKVLVTGAKGFLGYRLCHFLKEKNYQIYEGVHETLDLTKEDQVFEVLHKEKPDIVIHCAAISDVSLCAKKPELSYDINVNGSSYIAAACQKEGARMIFCSSDQVYFKSEGNRPHLETEILSPPHIYGKQKLEAEKKIHEICDNAVSLRLSWMYDIFSREGMEHSQLFYNIVKASRDHETILLPIHDKRSITNVWDIVENIEKFFTAPQGIYNYGSENELNTYSLVMEAFGKDLIKPNENAFLESPRNIMMDVSKAKKIGIHLPESLERMKRDAKNLLR